MFFAVSIVVDVEPAVQPEPRVEHECAHKGPGPVACVLQQRGQCRQLRTEAEQAVRSDAMDWRRDAGEHRGVRRERQRCRAVRACQSQPLAREPIELRRQPGRAAEGADAIRAERVDGDEQQVAAGAGAMANDRRGSPPHDKGNHARRQQNRNEKPEDPHTALRTLASRSVLVQEFGLRPRHTATILATL